VSVYFLLRNLNEKGPPMISAREIPRGATHREEEILSRSDADYDPEILAQFPGAQIVVRMEIDDQGHVTSAKVIHAPDPVLIPAAVAAVRTWTFVPAMQGDLPVASVHQSVIVLPSDRDNSAPVVPIAAPGT